MPCDHQIPVLGRGALLDAHRPGCHRPRGVRRVRQAMEPVIVTAATLTDDEKALLAIGSATEHGLHVAVGLIVAHRLLEAAGE